MTYFDDLYLYYLKNGSINFPIKIENNSISMSSFPVNNVVNPKYYYFKLATDC